MDHDALLKLAAELGAALKTQGWTLALAESCTGGMAAQVVTAIPGSSDWFECGFVTYSNLSKTEILGVSPHTLAAHGAVSEAVAQEMAQGALVHSHAQVAVAISGIAGPDGGTQEKPVGTVWLAWAGPGQQRRSTRHQIPGSRETIRRRAVEIALRGVIALTLTPDL